MSLALHEAALGNGASSRFSTAQFPPYLRRPDGKIGIFTGHRLIEDRRCEP
jgi:hypothetical protein